jgi:hypothetical protein
MVTFPNSAFWLYDNVKLSSKKRDIAAPFMVYKLNLTSDV